MAHGTTAHGFLAAVDALWATDGRKILRRELTPAAARRLLDEIVVPMDWVPESHLVELTTIVWEHLAREDRDAFRTWVVSEVEMGWGRVQKALLRLVTPKLLSYRAGALWRAEHDTGRLEARLLGRKGSVTLTDHPYVHHFATRLMLLEAFRHIIRMTGAESVTGRQHPTPHLLRVDFSWRSGTETAVPSPE